MLNNKTIAAISTAYGKGGVAMIRISGDEALNVALRVFKATAKDIKPRYCYYGSILRDGDIIDDGTLTYFKAPNSYTGEDVCEICCHGGIYATRAVLESVLSSGAVLAGAGEFTKRAYLNGKLTLSRAEAVGNVIDAKTDYQLRLSSSTARGVLSSKIGEIREKIISLITRSYATIDYPDEDIEDNTRQEMVDTLNSVYLSVSSLKKSYKAGRAVSEGIKTAIIGKPNAGKSSLYNLLLGEDVAIVTDIAGTTRDIIENVASIGGVTLNIADTAGIHDTSDVVEKIGVERAKGKIESSELLLCIFDSSTPETDEDAFIIDTASGKTAIAIINKSDTDNKLSSEFEQKIKDSFENVVYISAKDTSSLDKLASVISNMYELGSIDISNDAIISSARQFSSVSLALESIIQAKEALEFGETPDIICFTLEKALSELDMIDARETSEEIVNEIFSRFCVGK
ncbi:MAG: tRNA uridine-5-carboxymethylaminomethyl(34) synthesis GTPase MnmE [Clostridia bacterium]|nr:tRNA uridine-5-carboxymethylaminomethyl(34) synthesis GTPase MnmE [Clostridia bacterium]